MATVENRHTIQKMIENDGHYAEDPQLLAIYQYYNTGCRKVCWMIAYSKLDIDSMFRSSNCIDIKLLWNQKEGITQLGKLFLKGSIV